MYVSFPGRVFLLLHKRFGPNDILAQGAHVLELQPGVDACGVECVFAGKDAMKAPRVKLFQTNGAAFRR